MVSLDILGIVRRVIILSLLTYAGYSDIKTREISDKVWILMIVLAAPLAIYEVLSLHKTALYLVSLLIGFVVGAMIYLGKIMGDADAAAIATLSIVEPPPTVLHGFDIISLFPPISIVVNASLLSLIGVIYNLARNTYLKFSGKELFSGIDASLLEKILAFILYTKVEASVVREKPNFYSIAEKNTDSVKRFTFKVRIEEESHAEVQGEVWVSVYMPFIAFIALGYIIHVILGCIAKLLLPSVFTNSYIPLSLIIN